MWEGTTVGRTVGGGVADGEIVQIIDYQAYLIDSYFSMHFQKDSMTPGRCFIISCDWLEGQLVNSRVPEIVIYLRKYLHASFHHSSTFMRALCIHPLVLHEQDV